MALAGRWNLQDGEATADIQAVVGPAGTLNGGDTTLAKRLVGGPAHFAYGLNFNGADDWIDLGATLDQNGELTITAWVNPANVNDYREIIANANVIGDQQDYGFEINGALGTVRAIWGNAFIATSSANITAGNWHHVALVRSGVAGNWACELYIDGVVRASVTGVTSNPNATNQTTAIGRLGASDVLYYSGGIADVRIYNSALDAAGIAATMSPTDFDSAILGTTGSGLSLSHPLTLLGD